MEKRPAQQPEGMTGRVRRPINSMFRTKPGQPDFYNGGAVESAKRLWSPGIAQGAYEAPAPWLQVGGGRPEAFQRADTTQTQSQMTQPVGFKSTGGAGGGYMQSHDSRNTEPVFAAHASDDLNFQAMQHGGDPWFNPHQQVTRFAGNFMPQGIRRQRIDEQRSSPF